MLKFKITDSLPKTTGVYAIVRTGTDDFYIGSARGKRGFQGSFTSHKSRLKKGNHPAAHLLNVFNKHGFDVFEVWILDECPPS